MIKRFAINLALTTTGMAVIFGLLLFMVATCK